MKNTYLTQFLALSLVSYFILYPTYITKIHANYLFLYIFLTKFCWNFFDNNETSMYEKTIWYDLKKYLIWFE